MFKNLCLAATLVVVGALAGPAMAQTSQPTKTAPVAGIDSNWKNGLSNTDINMVNKVARGKSDNDRWMIWTAIVRNREASRDIYPGEALTNEKVLANTRVRMSTDEATRWTSTWGKLNAWERQALITVLRDDLSVKH